MHDNGHRKTFDSVLKTELEDINVRRAQIDGAYVEQIGPSNHQTTPGPKQAEAVQQATLKAIDEQLKRAWDSKLVGLALSGGGVRSGAVSLGLLQSLYHQRLLNQFDYMSTVSGGGYAGTYFSSMLRELNPQSGKIDWRPDESGDRDPKGPSGTTLDLAFARDRSQSEEMRRLIFGGFYLRKFQELISSTFFGVIVNWTMILAGLTAVASFFALIYRVFGHPRRGRLD